MDTDIKTLMMKKLSGKGSTRSGKTSVSKKDKGTPDKMTLSLHSLEQLLAMDKDQLTGLCQKLENDYQDTKKENHSLAQSLRHANDQLLRFIRIASIAHHLCANEFESEIVTIGTIPSYLKCHFAAIFMHDNENDKFTPFRSTTAIDEKLVMDENGAFLHRLFNKSSEPFLMKHQTKHFTGDLHDNHVFRLRVSDAWWQLIGETAIVFPIVTNRASVTPVVIGGLIIGSAAGLLTENDLKMLRLFADFLSTSLINSTLMHKLKRMAVTDSLTGLYNRRQMIIDLERAISQASRGRVPLSISMLDLDHFKTVNDTRGHSCGDMILREFAGLLHEQIRKNVDIPARYGGEEFVIIMPFTQLKQAVTMNERIRSTLERRKFMFDNQYLGITCSIGVAEYVPEESWSELVNRVDAALYLSKNCGRNRVSTLS
ncbi:MAG: GGDEF domain-containing protein [Planctomycetota bacterium]|nr:GGDEF domain-containing protein [Planctomycetota bacterium]